MATPRVGEAGATGAWRSERPVLVAPEACLAVKADKIELPDLSVVLPRRLRVAQHRSGHRPDLLQGVRICAAVCPAQAIEMQPEHEPGACGR